MASYKEAHEKMNNTGNGLGKHSLEFTTFQEFIVKNVCKYYFQLDPVLRDRPNVYPWFTNEGVRQNGPSNNNMTTAQATLSISSDDDSVESSMVPNDDPIPSNLTLFEIDMENEEDIDEPIVSNLSTPNTSSSSNNN